MAKPAMLDRAAIHDLAERLDREVARSMPGQETAIALLDWLFESRVLVYCDYGAAEREWLSNLTGRLQALVSATGATGVQSMWVKQMVLWLLEASLSDLRHAPTNPAHGEDARTAAIADLNQANLSLLCVNFMESREGVMVRRISDGLAAEFNLMPASMRVDLAGQCLAYQHPLDPLEFFCWMLEMGVIRSKRYRQKNAVVRPSLDALRRVGMQCQLEATRAYRAGKRPAPASITEERRRADAVPSIEVDGYLSGSAILSMVANNPALLRRTNYADAVLRAGQWAAARRRRRFDGTQAKWPGRLGALMVVGYRLQEPNAALYSGEDNAGRVTDRVSKKLKEYGLVVAARTIYKSFVDLTQGSAKAD